MLWIPKMKGFLHKKGKRDKNAVLYLVKLANPELICEFPLRILYGKFIMGQSETDL